MSFLSVALGTGSADPNDIATTLEDLVAAELAPAHTDAVIKHSQRALAISPDLAAALGNPSAETSVGATPAR